MLKIIPAILLSAALLAGCSKQSAADNSTEATLPELTRTLQTWVMAKGSYPKDLHELTNFPTMQGKRLPTPPPGKKLSIDPATRQVVWVDQK